MLEVLRCNIKKIDRSKLADQASTILSPEEICRSKKFKFEKDYKLYVAGKIMARTALAGKCGCSSEQIEFRIDEYGRPHLDHPLFDNLDFNISHSGDYVVLALGYQPIGIDIERIKKIDTDLVHEVFHKKEIDYVLEDRLKMVDRFFRLWTLKEAFIKAIGEGLSCPLKSFYFQCRQDEKIRININGNPGKSWRFALLNLDEKYSTALCYKGTCQTAVGVKDYFI